MRGHARNQGKQAGKASVRNDVNVTKRTCDGRHSRVFMILKIGRCRPFRAISYSRLPWSEHNPETDGEVPFERKAAVAGRRPEALGVVGPDAATEHTKRARRRPLRVMGNPGPVHFRLSSAGPRRTREMCRCRNSFHYTYDYSTAFWVLSNNVAASGSIFCRTGLTARDMSVPQCVIVRRISGTAGLAADSISPNRFRNPL
jgi:hypothetical protein